MLPSRISIAITFSLAFVVVSGYLERRFTTRWFNGTETVMVFQHHNPGECLYDIGANSLICVDNFPFNSISSAWRIHPKNISYIYVRCREQNMLSDYPNRCICKSGKTSASRKAHRKADEFKFCVVNDLLFGTLNHLSALEVLDLSYNEIEVVQNEAFSGLKHLGYISLSHNPIRTLPDELFCHSLQLHYVHLQHVNISLFPSNSFRCRNGTLKITYIDFSWNKIHTLFDNQFKMLPFLVFLNLSNNAINNIYFDAFFNTVSLQALDLSANSLTELPPRFCQGLRNISNLYLSGNRIKVLHATPLLNCSHIQQLDLSSNLINHIPQGLNLTSLQSLKLSENDLTELRPSMFSALPSLLHMDISQNRIKCIMPQTFAKIINLRRLNLSRNKLEDCSAFNKVFQHMDKLKSLDLSVNLLNSLSNESFGSLKSLQFLDLSYNYISFFNPTVFRGLFELKYLSLRGNKISLLPSGAFKDLLVLKELDLSQNYISTIQVDTFPESSFTLHLFQNSLQAVPAGLENTNITYLDLSRNNIRKLNYQGFGGMRNLRSLDLSHNSIREIVPGALLSLVNLKNLTLEHNELTIDFEENYFEGPVYLESLNLAYNQIQHLNNMFKNHPFQYIQYLNLSNNPIRHILESLSPSYETSQIHVLSLDNCNISAVAQFAFNGLDNLKIVYLRNNSLSHLKPFITNQELTVLLHGNPLVCSCDMQWLKQTHHTYSGKRLPKSRYQVETCTFTQNSLKKAIINAKVEEFLCISKANCDKNCFCYTNELTELPSKTICTGRLSALPKRVAFTSKQLFLDGNNFEHLGELSSITNENGMQAREIYLNSSRIVSVSANLVQNFPRLVILHLDNNRIMTLPPFVFKQLNLLEELYLNKNEITYLSPQVFAGLHSLKYLDVSHNKLKLLSPNTLSAFSTMQALRSVHLEENPWYCGCESQEFYHWLHYNYSILGNRRDVQCNGKIILELHPSAFRCEPSVIKKVLVISMIVSVIVLALIITFLVRYRREVIALLYVKMNLSRFRRRSKIYRPFDVFLIYDETDKNCQKWLESTFLPKLENGPKAFKIFIPDRNNANLERRLSIASNSTELIKQCKCTVMIVSRDIAGNSWSSMCLQAAISWALKEPSHKVILVFYGNVNISTLDDEIKRKIQRRDYLTARGRCFWYRLEYELPKPTVNGQEITEHEARMEEDTAIIHNSVVIDNTSYV